VRFSILRCFFFRILLRLFLISEPISDPRYREKGRNGLYLTVSYLQVPYDDKPFMYVFGMQKEIIHIFE